MPSSLNSSLLALNDPELWPAPSKQWSDSPSTTALKAKPTTASSSKKGRGKWTKLEAHVYLKDRRKDSSMNKLGKAESSQRAGNLIPK